MTAGRCRFCCKSPFALVIKIYFGCTHDCRVKLWGTSSAEDKLTDDLGNAIEGTRISGRRWIPLTAEKLAPGDLGLLQQYLPGPDVSRRSKGGLFDYLIGTQQDRCRQIDTDR